MTPPGSVLLQMFHWWTRNCTIATCTWITLIYSLSSMTSTLLYVEKGWHEQSYRLQTTLSQLFHTNPVWFLYLVAWYGCIYGTFGHFAHSASSQHILIGNILCAWLGPWIKAKELTHSIRPASWFLLDLLELLGYQGTVDRVCAWNMIADGKSANIFRFLQSTNKTARPMRCERSCP